MLKNALDNIQSHIDIGDDYIPQLRVEFGTGQVANAYGCGLYFPERSPICAHGNVLKSAEDVLKLEEPELDAGLFKKYTSKKKYNFNRRSKKCRERKRTL